MSRNDTPKQLLHLVEGRSLLAIAAARIEHLVPAANRYVCAAERYRAAIQREIPWLDDAHMLGEPAARDTVNAVAFAAMAIAARDPDGVFAVLTSDHLLEPQAEFERAMETGFRLVEADPRRLVTFAITPTFPATGYGYVERGDAIAGFDGAFLSKRFVEKPPLERAQEFVANPAFGWNSGMFVFHARTVLDALERFKPETAAGMREIAAAWGKDGSGANGAPGTGAAGGAGRSGASANHAGTDHARATLDRVYPTLPRISVDHALMEPASRDASLVVCVVPMDIKWKDVGSWTSYGETLAADASGNRTNARAVNMDSARVLSVSDDPKHTIATIGLRDVIIVRTKDATLVVRADLAEKVKDIAGLVPEDTR